MRGIWFPFKRKSHATASQAIFGNDFRITVGRGQFQATEWCQRTVAIWHPAAILRAPDAGRQTVMKQQFICDLRAAVDQK